MPHGQSLEQQQTRCSIHEKASLLQCLVTVCLHLLPAALQPDCMLWHFKGVFTAGCCTGLRTGMGHVQSLWKQPVYQKS